MQKTTNIRNRRDSTPRNLGLFVFPLAAFLCLVNSVADWSGIPKEFVDLKKAIPDLDIDLRYFGTNNFVGKPIDGYTAHRAWMTKEAAEQLAKVQDELRQFSLRLKIFDAYRPQSAVDHFIRWSQSPAISVNKTEYHPDIEKSELFEKGYLAELSGHSRGSTVDLTLVSLPSGKSKQAVELDMGTPFDFFGPASATKHPDLTAQQRANRLLLKTIMERHGFVNYSAEWWHFRLKDEPFPTTYFNIPTGGL